MPAILAVSLGLFFFASGWLKAIDPFGGALKIEEYLAAFNLASFDSYAMVFSIMLCAFEMSLGIFLFLGVCRRLTAVAATCMMLAFTILTAYLAFDPYVAIQECGCFGEAIDLTNMQTFIKNVIILFVVVIYTLLVFSQQINTRRLSLIVPVILFSLLVPLYSYIYLPPFDFLSYNRGVNITNDNISLYSDNYQDVTNEVLNGNIRPNLWFVVHDVVNDSELSKIMSIIEFHKDKFTYSVISNVKQVNINNISHYYVDDVVIKELIRAKSGVILLNDGVITGKWSLRQVNPHDISNQRGVVFKYFLFITFGIIIIFLTFLWVNRNETLKQS